MLPATGVVWRLLPMYEVLENDVFREIVHFINMAGRALRGECEVPELRAEREGSVLVADELMYFVLGRDFVEMKREKEQTVLNDPMFRSSDKYYLSGEEAFDRIVEKCVHLNYIKRRGNFTEEETTSMRVATGDELPDAVHDHLFIPTIRAQGTDEQKDKWLPLARNYSILGAYAQTELGHGTYIRGLETTATYDPNRQEFVLNSPTLTSIKWWPGALGHIATHAIVVARLITLGRDHGPHTFIVQLRSLDNHKPLSGIQLGDVGPAFGYKGVNNGFLRLTNVAIPRDHMLMRYAKVSPEGTYTRPVLDKMMYATMVHARVYLLIVLSYKLSYAVTIAVRYSAVRKESIGENNLEIPLLDHQYQQYKLFTLLACVYAILPTEDYMDRLYQEAVARIAEGNFSLLPEVHATSSGLKAFISDLCCRGIETCRLACGIHGNMLSCGLGTLYVDTTAIQHFEGDNTVLMLQTARYLLKMFNQRLTQSQLPHNIVYLASDYPKHTSCAAHTPEQFSDHHILLEAYRQRARRMIELAADQYNEEVDTGVDSAVAMNAASIDWTHAARAHSYLVVLKAFTEAIHNYPLCPANHNILTALCSLYAVNGIVECSGEFTMDGYMSTNQLAMARTHLYSLLTIIRCDAVPLVDAFDIHDDVLNSVLGRFDGDVYTHMYQSAVNSPSNKSEVHEVYYKSLRSLFATGQPTSKL